MELARWAVSVIFDVVQFHRIFLLFDTQATSVLSDVLNKEYQSLSVSKYD